jgi:hypothetical protein
MAPHYFYFLHILIFTLEVKLLEVLKAAFFTDFLHSGVFAYREHESECHDPWIAHLRGLRDHPPPSQTIRRGLVDPLGIPQPS